MAAFTPGTFSGNVGGGSASNTLFVYSTNDTKAEVIVSGYFNALTEIVAVGDIIMVAFDLDGTMGSAVIHVAGNTSGVVTTGYAVIA